MKKVRPEELMERIKEAWPGSRDYLDNMSDEAICANLHEDAEPRHYLINRWLAEGYKEDAQKEIDRADKFRRLHEEWSRLPYMSGSR